MPVLEKRVVLEGISLLCLQLLYDIPSSTFFHCGTIHVLKYLLIQMSQTETYDIAIVGSGPAGYSASIYASRYKLKNIVFGKMIGGTISEAHKVCNYPGISDITGLELGMKFQQQAKENGADILNESIIDIKKEDNLFKLITNSGKEFLSKTVLIATGTDRCKLAIPDEDKYLGKGLSYCATCDAMFYKGKTVAVIGGANAATMAAVMLSDIAKQVYIIYRGTELKGEPAWIDQVNSRKNISVIFTTVVTGLEGEEKLKKIKLSKEYNNSQYLEIDGLFVEIGSEPNNILPSKLELNVDEKGYIQVDSTQATNLDGVWSAGDCTTNSNKFKQVVTAVAEGAVATNAIYSYLRNKV